MNSGIAYAMAAVLVSAPALGMPLQRSVYAMGTQLEFEISGMSRTQALAASELAIEAVRADERRISTWSKESEFSALNRAPVGKSQTLSPASARDLGDAYRCALETGFAFTPWIGPLVKAWGLREGGRRPTAAEKAAAREASAPDAFSLRGNELVRSSPMAAIEEGGFGKGVALDDAVVTLKRAGVKSAVLNFGGQIAVMGERRVPVEISNPAQRSATLLRFTMRAGSVATSSNSEHTSGHLLDPRQGEPAPLAGSVTVIAARGVDADCHTKIFVLGREKGLVWANEHHLAVLWVEPALRGGYVAHTSCDWPSKLEPVSRDVRVLSDCTPFRTASLHQ